MKENEILSLLCEDRKFSQLLFTAFEVAPGPFQLFRYEFFFRQDGLVLGGKDLVGQVVEGIMRLSGTLLSTKDQADWWVFAGLGPVFAGVVEIEVHLTSVSVAEFTNLQVGQE
jgi:hypothetical protein